jgi:hypothetical protein
MGSYQAIASAMALASKGVKNRMSLAGLLALAMLMSPSPGRVLALQDAPNPPTGSTQSAPPAEPAQAEPGKNEAPADSRKAPDEAKSEDSKKTDERTKTNERGKSTPPNNQAEKKRITRKGVKPAEEGEPHRVVVRRGGALEPNAQIAPDMPPEEAVRQRHRAEEMLSAAEDRLKLLAGRTLQPPQQETTTQIRNYLEKARSALRDGDTQRGHTLALKAYLLADDLVKH